MVSLEDVAAMALALVEVTEGHSRTNRSWEVAGKAFVWERPFTKADLRRYGDRTPPTGPIVAVRLEDLAERDAVLAEGHPGFFVTEHFAGYPAVLIALDEADPEQVRETLLDGWLACAPARLTRDHLRP